MASHYTRGYTVPPIHVFHSFPLSLQELQDFCFRFAMNHMTAITQTEAFTNLDENVLKSFIVRAAQNGAFKY